jgi:hypothetical protein
VRRGLVWLRAPAARNAAALSWLVITGSAALGTLPLTTQLNAALRQLPRGDAELFERGGLLLLDLLSDKADTLAAAAVASGMLLLWSLPIQLWARATLWSTLTTPEVSLTRAAANAVSCWPRFALAWTGTRVLQVSFVLLGPLALGPLVHALGGDASERTRDLWLLATVGAGATLALALQLCWTVLAAHLLSSSTMAASLRATLATARSIRSAPIFAWLGFHAAGLGFPALAMGLVASSLAGAHPLWATLVHQLGIAGSIVMQTSAASEVIRWTNGLRVRVEG